MEAIKKHINQINLIRQYEKQCNQLRAQVKDGDLDEETAEDLIEANREKLLAGLEASFDLSEEIDIERVYENILFGLLTDEVRRMFGYGKAMNRYEETIQHYNTEIGENVLQFDRKEAERTLYNIGRIYFIRQIGVQLGLTVSDVDRIANNMIDRYFKPEKK